MQILIEFGEYQLTRYDDESWWMEHKDGEGMQIPDSNLEKLLQDYFKENF